MTEHKTQIHDRQRRSNVRLAVAIAGIALLFYGAMFLAMSQA